MVTFLNASAFKRFACFVVKINIQSKNKRRARLNNSKQPMCWGVLISLVMSKQLRHKGQGSVEVLGATLHSEARTAYKKALYQVHKDGQWGCKGLGGSSPPSSKKRRMMGTGSDDEGSTEGGGSAEGAVRLDPVEMEMDAWAR